MYKSTSPLHLLIIVSACLLVTTWTRAADCAPQITVVDGELHNNGDNPPLTRLSGLIAEIINEAGPAVTPVVTIATPFPKASARKPVDEVYGDLRRIADEGLPKTGPLLVLLHYSAFSRARQERDDPRRAKVFLQALRGREEPTYVVVYSRSFWTRQDLFPALEKEEIERLRKAAGGDAQWASRVRLIPNDSNGGSRWVGGDDDWAVGLLTDYVTEFVQSCALPPFAPDAEPAADAEPAPAPDASAAPAAN
jgi:hypothetical protein